MFDNEDSEIDVPDGKSLQEKIVSALEASKKPLSPQDLVDAVGASSTEVATAMKSLLKENKKVTLKSGAFSLSR